MRRDPEPSADLVDVEEPRLKGLRVDHVQADLLVLLNPRLKHRCAMRIGINAFPVSAELVEVLITLEGLVEMQNIRHAAAIRPETADISLGRDRGPDRLAPHRDDAVTANAVPSEAAQMQDFVWLAALNGV